MAAKDLKEKTCCLSGHRNLTDVDVGSLRMHIEEAVSVLIDSGYRYFGVGGARGFDMEATDVLLHLRDTKYPEIRIILVLTCENHKSNWEQFDIARNRLLMSKANKVKVLNKEWHKGCELERDRLLVDQSSFLLCWCTQEKGGTAYTKRYAEKCGLWIRNLAGNNHCPFENIETS